MKYTKDFSPRIGDRIYYKESDTSLREGTILDLVEDGKALIRYYDSFFYKKHVQLDDLIFIKEKPWYCLF